MGRRANRNAAGWFGGVSLGLGAIASTLTAQTSSVCSTSLLLAAAGGSTGQDCAVFSLVYHGGLALMALGGILLIGAFILSLGVEPWSERRERPVPDRGVKMHRRDRA